MTHSPWLDEFLIILIAACVVVPVFHRLRLSPVLGYLAAGALIGPHGIGIIRDDAAVIEIGHFGVVFLLFAIGLELSLERLRVMRFMVFGLGTAQLLLTALAIGGLAMALSVSHAEAIILGGGLALSSTAIVLQDLMARNEMATRAGRVALAVLLLQDLAVVPLLSLVPLLGPFETNVLLALGLALGRAAIALVAIVVVGRLVVRPLLRIVAHARSPELFTGLTLLIVLGVSWLTELAGLSMALGAFLAGLVIAETEYRHQVEADILPFRGILLSLFFMTVGMAIDLTLLVRNLAAVLVCVGVLIALKAFILSALCRLSGYPATLSTQTGITLAQGSEFGFVLFGQAMAQGVLAEAVGQLALSVVALSMAATPFLLSLARKMTRRMAPIPAPETSTMAEEVHELRNHVLICGFGRVGQTLAKLLKANNMAYLAVDLEPARVAEGRSRNMPVFYGDACRPDVLKAAGAARARAAVITLDHPHAAERAVTVLRRSWPDLTIVVRARDSQQSASLEFAGASVVVPEMIEGSLHLGAALLHTLGQPAEQINRVLDHFREQAYASLEDVIPAQPTTAPASDAPKP